MNTNRPGRKAKYWWWGMAVSSGLLTLEYIRVLFYGGPEHVPLAIWMWTILALLIAFILSVVMISRSRRTE